MNCNQAETAMMQHMEKTIEPETAKSLAKHVLQCKTCREVYLVFDQSMDCVDSIQAPAGFTESVMASVTKMHVSQAQNILKFLWGISGVLIGIVLTSDGFVNAANEAVLRLGQMDFINIEISNSLGFVSLFFVIMLSGLLYVLQQQEKGILHDYTGN